MKLTILCSMTARTYMAPGTLDSEPQQPGQDLNSIKDMRKFSNPIVPGFYPDPSVTKVGDTYFLANSSFQFFPGIPIHSSKDLVNWKLIGNAINRTEQLDMSGAVTRIVDRDAKRVYSTGLYAPTIRYHAGTFYVICTLVLPDEKVHESGRLLSKYRNFIVKTDDIYGDLWSDPIFFDFYGIDPDIFWDDDGKVYVTAARTHITYKTIQQAEIDLDTGKLLTPFADVWEGHAKILTEGPHIYKRDGDYYLLVAEGGTSTGHMISIAKSASVNGPYETCDRNPVLTAAGTDEYVQCVGHGDLFEGLEAGEWWATVLAVREAKNIYPLGRETFLTPVTWNKGEFPVFEKVKMVMETSYNIGTASKKSIDYFDMEAKDILYLRTPDLASYRQHGTYIYLKPAELPIDTNTGSTTFMSKRQTDPVATFGATLFIPPSLVGTKIKAGVTVYKDTSRHLTMFYDATSRTINFEARTLEHLETNSIWSSDEILSSSIDFQCQSSGSTYVFFYSIDSGRNWTEVTSYSAASVSGYDFTGVVLGIYATGKGPDVKFWNVHIAY